MASTALVSVADVGSSGPWVRDLCLVGGATGVGAPLAVLASVGMLSLPAASLFLATSGLLGLAVGALLGRATPALMRWRLGRSPRIAFLAAGAGVGALCGVAVGGIAGAVALPGHAFWQAAAILAAPVGALQLGWFWLAAAQRRVRRRPVAGMLTAAALAAPVIGLGVLHALALH